MTALEEDKIRQHFECYHGWPAQEYPTTHIKGTINLTEKKNIITGEAALDALVDVEDVERNEFTYLKSNSSFTVKVPGLNVISAFVYGSFEKKIYSFIAENESKKSAKGFPVENLTPFDKAFKYYKDQSDDWQDEMSAKANHYKADQKFTIGFYDLDTGEPIAVEFTRNQAQVIVQAIRKNEKYLDKFAFTLAKTGSGRDTKVSLTVIPMLDELTDEQRKNFEELPNDFDAKNFEGLYYEMSDEEQIETLQRDGFDITLIGLEAPENDVNKAEENNDNADGQAIDIDSDDLPF